MFLLESPHRHTIYHTIATQYTIFNMNKKNTLNYPRLFSKGLNNEFETAVVKEPSVFEPLKFYCIVKNDCGYPSLSLSLSLSLYVSVNIFLSLPRPILYSIFYVSVLHFYNKDTYMCTSLVLNTRIIA